MTQLATQIGEIATAIESFKSEYNSRLFGLEQRAAREKDMSGEDVGTSLGELVANHDEIKNITSSFRGKSLIQLERAALTSANTTVGAGRSAGTSLVQADRRPGIVAPPERRFTIRDLIPSTSTTSNSIEYPKETGFTNNAAPVAEGAQKPYSDITFDLVTSPVRTLAHLFKASRQIMDDTPALAGYINTRGQYGLKLVEETQLLNGNNTGQNLNGIIPQASAYETSRTASGDTELDILLHAISQAEEAELPASGIVLSVRDWRRILGIKDLGGNYLSDGPFGTTAPRIWDLPVIPSMAMPVGNFLLGGFETGAEIFDRLEIEFLISSENSDDFEKNLITARIEERLALAVYRPEAFVKGSLVVA
ncbi:phage major capsid protein [Phyllobacterium sp. YR531]|uniref:phage major capsid protein n=1 Tax=Phyllobacterium sp. YR531 TaxID=1144343 RepID=UPI00026F5B5D|nr:phage major capsid protein [Phyllobacterium sp. YR531]EJN04481.1 phage major capsid protein, HK97 family [Phyllobacterium sp. YR531]